MTVAAGPLVRVDMGELRIGAAPEVLETLLGSCVGIALWDPHRRQGGLAHVVLPESRGNTSLPGKFADTAVAEMVRQLRLRGVSPSGLIAKIAGGATMFGARTAQDIGQRNCDAVRRELVRHKIRLAGEHLAGNQGRLIQFSLEDGSVCVLVGKKEVAVL